MSSFSELLEAGKRHFVTLKNRKGKTLVRVPLLWAVVIVIAAPQVLVAVLVAMVLEIIEVEYDGRQINLDRLN
jgi:hypothetical protein